MAPVRVTVATHGHCFDGLASAVMFTHLVRALGGSSSQAFSYRSCGYGPNMRFIPPSWLDGDVNAILDFRYTPTERLSWFFDHHVTGFGSAEERDRVLGARTTSATPPTPGNPQIHYDVSYGSCTKLIADVARDRFGVETDRFEDLIRWADHIDAARFESASRALDDDEPVLRLAAVVEHHGDGPFLNEMVPRLLEVPLLDLAESPDIAERFRPIQAARQAYIERVREAAVERGSVVVVDMTDAPVTVTGKFVTYALYPQCTYSVVLVRSKQHFKLSVGYNPWSGRDRLHDIATICKQYGGGGHPVVGAATFALDKLDEAREAARAVAALLEP